MHKSFFSTLDNIQWGLQKNFARVVAWFCECQWKWIKTPLLYGFAFFYKVNLKDCTRMHLSDYHSLNDLFARTLKPEARPYSTDPTAILSPVDGSISQIGVIQGETLLQAKGKSYTLYDLLARDQESIRLFRNGYFGTFYLAPSDYHRVHMPVSGTVAYTTYVPGFLFSVGKRNTQRISQLFTRNERVMTLFKTDVGPLMIIQVGSCFVGNMGTTWESKNTTPRRTQQIARISYVDREHCIPRAKEMGYFKLGSTVIVLFAQGSMQWEDSLYIGKQVRYGECIGKTLPRGIEPLFTP